MRKPVRIPVSAELWCVPDGLRGKVEERVYVNELAAYLNTMSGRLTRLAKKWGTPVKRQRILGADRQYYVSPHTAMRLIAYVRAEQGALMARGRDRILDVAKRKLKRERERLFASTGDVPSGAASQGTAAKE